MGRGSSQGAWFHKPRCRRKVPRRGLKRGAVQVDDKGRRRRPETSRHGKTRSARGVGQGEKEGRVEGTGASTGTGERGGSEAIGSVRFDVRPGKASRQRGGRRSTRVEGGESARVKGPKTTPGGVEKGVGLMRRRTLKVDWTRGMRVEKMEHARKCSGSGRPGMSQKKCLR